MYVYRYLYVQFTTKKLTRFGSIHWNHRPPSGNRDTDSGVFHWQTNLPRALRCWNTTIKLHYILGSFSQEIQTIIAYIVLQKSSLDRRLGIFRHTAFLLSWKIQRSHCLLLFQIKERVKMDCWKPECMYA